MIIRMALQSLGCEAPVEAHKEVVRAANSVLGSMPRAGRGPELSHILDRILKRFQGQSLCLLKRQGRRVNRPGPFLHGEEVQIPMKKTIGAIIAGYVVQVGGLFVIHSMVLKQDYVNTASVWRSYEAHTARIWAMLLAVLIYVVGAVLIYVRGAEARPWVGQGIRFGILIALVSVVYGSLSGWVIMPIPHMLAVKWIVLESLLSVVFGLVVAAICQAKSVGA